jgi:hypothetical protein
MADPLAILGAVETCFNLSQTLWNIAVDIRNMQSDHASLSLDYEYDKIVLNKFIDFFRTYQESIDENVRRMMVKLIAELDTDLPSCKATSRSAEGQEYSIVDFGISSRMGSTW